MGFGEWVTSREGELFGEGCNPLIQKGMLWAKAPSWQSTDVDWRKHGDQTGLETPVVHAVNEGCSCGQSVRLKSSETWDWSSLPSRANYHVKGCLTGGPPWPLPGLLTSQRKGDTPPEIYGRKAETQRDKPHPSHTVADPS